MKLRPTTPSPDAERSPADLIGGRVHVDVLVPRTEVKGRMRLVTRLEALDILGAARAAFEARHIPLSIAEPGVLDAWNLEIATRHLATAVRDPRDESKPLATMEEWSECDEDQIAALWEEYKDQRERLDPLSQDVVLSDQQFAAIRSAVKKKEQTLLRQYGSSLLTAYLLTSDEPPST